MQSTVTRTLFHLAIGVIAINAAIACGGADAAETPREPTPSEPFEPPPPPDASTEGHRIEGLTGPWLMPDAGFAKLPNATCQPNCLPLDWLPDVLRSAGLDVWEDPNWKTNSHGTFTDLWGIVAHHTGHVSDDAWTVVRDGRPDLDGPLSQLVLEQNGMYRVVARGVSWHAGNGTYPGLEGKSANFYTIGIEAVNTGLESWSSAQYEAYVRGVAAILKYLGHDSARVIGHKEWAGVSQGKWDPGNIDMNVFRKDVQAILDM